MYGDAEETTAIAELSGLNATLCPMVVGNVAGLAYLVPKPELDHGYTDIQGVVACATATFVPFGLKATAYPAPVGKTDGAEYSVPNPFPDQG